MDLKNLTVDDLKAKLQAVDKKTYIKFGIGFGAIILFLIIYYAILNPIVNEKKAQHQAKILKENEILENYSRVWKLFSIISFKSRSWRFIFKLK